MKVTSCNSAYRLRYWNGPAITIVLPLRQELQQCLPFTVLKLLLALVATKVAPLKLQQCLPFTVLKLIMNMYKGGIIMKVATVLTVYGIETQNRYVISSSFTWNVATVLTVYGIETVCYWYNWSWFCRVATVLTVYGIETCNPHLVITWFCVATVLTVYGIETLESSLTIRYLYQYELQQCLPFMVLKL